MYNRQEDLDNLVWDKNDEDAEKSQMRMRLTTICNHVEHLVEEMFQKPATLVTPLVIGGFNILYRIHVEGMSPDVMVRLPLPSLVQFPVEKINQEAATGSYIINNTKLPLPHQFFSGQDPNLGPYIILQHIENQGTMSGKLTIPNDNPDVIHVLNPDISEGTLVGLWDQTARYVLQLCRLSFPRIGSLVQASDGLSYKVGGRPITHNMTDMIRLANIPRAILPEENGTYGTADEWYVALSEMHIAQLVFQHNDAVSSEDDCRNKYVARQIFRRLAKQGRLSTFGFAEDDWSVQSSTTIMSRTLSPAPAGCNSFRLWGDDFRPGNILVDDSDKIAAIIDWEYTYAAPTQFILDPPWWLLLDTAEAWSSGIDDWKKTYEPRLKTWLHAMKQAESETDEPGPLPVALSTYMEESWKTGRFWLSYGARKSWVFDAAYWRYLDERFFGSRGEDDVPKHGLWKTRIHLLSQEERDAMEPFVKRKMVDAEERIVVDWDPLEAKQRLSELLFD